MDFTAKITDFASKMEVLIDNVKSRAEAMRVVRMTIMKKVNTRRYKVKLTKQR